MLIAFKTTENDKLNYYLCYMVFFIGQILDNFYGFGNS